MIEPITFPPAPAVKKEGGITCFEIVLFFVFLLGTAVNFTKTQDLMAAFAPKLLFGYSGLENVYGIACALLVDGLVAAMKAKILFMGRAKSMIEWGYDILLTLFPFIISAFAQVFDSFLVRDTLASQPAEIQFMANWFIPLIPTLVVLGVLIYGFIHSAPEGIFSGDIGKSSSSSGPGFISWISRIWPFNRSRSANPQSASTD